MYAFAGKFLLCFLVFLIVWVWWAWIHRKKDPGQGMRAFFFVGPPLGVVAAVIAWYLMPSL